MSLFERLLRPTKMYHNTGYEHIAKRNGFDGHNKMVVVTDDASGVGFSISRPFTEAGVARIIMVSRSAGPQQKAKADLKGAYPTTHILMYQASVTDSDRIAKILQKLGTVNILILSTASAWLLCTLLASTLAEMNFTAHLRTDWICRRTSGTTRTTGSSTMVTGV